MKHSQNIRLLYFAFAMLLFVTEVLIALFTRDGFVRLYLGDILVIPLLCCIFRIIFPNKPKLLGIYIIAVGIFTEILQYFRLDKVLGIEGTVLGIILGSTFDIKDLLCYAVGGLLFFGAEYAFLTKCHR